MPSLSGEAIIAIAALFLALPPSLAVIYHLRGRNRNGRNDHREDQDVELATRSNINLHIIQHVKDTVLRPVIAHFPTR